MHVYALFLMCPKKILGVKHAMLFTAVYLPTQSVHPDRGLPNTKERHLYRCHTPVYYRRQARHLYLFVYFHGNRALR